MPVLQSSTVAEAAQIIRQGGVVVFPTETVYGLGACATNLKAIDAIYRIKRRPRDNPLICHFASIEQIASFDIVITPIARVLLEHFAPGPLSVLLELPDTSPLLGATGGRSSIIVRIPNHVMALELIERAGCPITAPSANTSGRISGTEIGMIMDDVGGAVDGYVDGGRSVVGIESTIVDARSANNVNILRAGVLGAEDIQTVLEQAYQSGRIAHMPVISEQVAAHEVTPGTRYRHYAPQTTLIGYIDSGHAVLPKTDVYIATTEWLVEHGIVSSEQLIEKNGTWYCSLGSRLDLFGIARRLYYALYQVDCLRKRSACLVLEDMGSTAVARALRDRMKKMIADSI